MEKKTIDENPKHLIMKNEPDAKGQMLYDSIHMPFAKTENYALGKQIS